MRQPTQGIAILESCNALTAVKAGSAPEVPPLAEGICPSPNRGQFQDGVALTM